MECQDCNTIFEYIDVSIQNKEDPQCPNFRSQTVVKLISTPHIRMDSDSILRSMPDPVPPLRELIGKNKEGCEGGFNELSGEQRQLKDYNRKKDSRGNSIWTPKERTYFHRR